MCRNRAKALAVELAKLDLAAQMKVSVNAITKIEMSSHQVNSRDAETTVSTMIMNSVNAKQRIGNTTTLLELYREVEHGNVEVMVRLGYDLGEILK